MAIDPKIRRLAMVRDQLQARGISDQRVLEAMSRVPRHLFVEEALQGQAYSDNALPIGFGQTISQPFSVARMSQALDVPLGAKVLEIGTGSGYQAAVLAEMGAEVYTVERVRALYLRALDLLARLKYYHVQLKLDDGTLGWPEYSPYDRILVTAGGPGVPEPLLRQLADGGKLVMPLGDKGQQQLVSIRKDGKCYYKRDLGPARFVDLVGECGWSG